MRLAPTGTVKVDRAGHQCQVRQAEDRVILAVMAVWPDDAHEITIFSRISHEGR
jgi:hypothetical protein